MDPCGGLIIYFNTLKHYLIKSLGTVPGISNLLLFFFHTRGQGLVKQVFGGCPTGTSILPSFCVLSSPYGFPTVLFLILSHLLPTSCLFPHTMALFSTRQKASQPSRGSCKLRTHLFQLQLTPCWERKALIPWRMTGSGWVIQLLFLDPLTAPTCMFTSLQSLNFLELCGENWSAFLLVAHLTVLVNHLIWSSRSVIKFPSVFKLPRFCWHLLSAVVCLVLLVLMRIYLLYSLNVLFVWFFVPWGIMNKPVG